LIIYTSKTDIHLTASFPEQPE